VKSDPFTVPAAFYLQTFVRIGDVMLRPARFLGVVMAVLLAVSLPAGMVRAESLADTLVAAYRHSNLLEQNRALLRAADEDVVQAVSRVLPVLRFATTALARHEQSAIGGGPTTTTNTARLSAQLSAEMTLIDFGRGELGIRIAREQVLATRASLVAVEQQVLLSAVRAYLNVRSGRQTLALRRNNVELIEQELRAARERFSLGDSTRTDVAIAEARLAAAQSALSAAEGDVAVSREEFNFVVGRYPGSLSAPPAVPRLPRSLAEAQEIARRNHPAILQAQHQVSVADLAAQSATLERYGAVTGQVGVGVDTSRLTGGIQRNGLDASASVTWSVPLYSGGRIPSVERQTIARQDAQRAALHQTVAQVMQSVGSNWAQLAVSRARVAASDSQIEASRSAYEAVRAEAELGSRTTLDVLNAEQELLDAQSNRILAAAAVQLAGYALLESMGQLTVSSLNLGVPTYDVEAYSSGFSPRARAVQPSVQGQRLDLILGRQGQP
jgi:outer membrane protein